MTSTRSVVHTDAAPAAIGPYSQAIIAHGLVFCSGQIPLDPTGGPMANDIGDQTRRVMDNLSAVLLGAGTSMEKVVKTTIFLTDLADFAAVNTIYASYFLTDPPARSTVQVAALPRGARIEIEATAIR